MEVRPTSASRPGRRWPVHLLLAAALAQGASAAADEGAGGSRPFELRLPHGRPDRFVVEVEHDGTRRSIELQRHEVRAPGFRVRVHRADGSYAAYDPLPAATYRGRVLGVPAARVFARLGPGGLWATVVGDGRDDWSIRPVATEPGRGLQHVVSERLAGVEHPVDCPHGVTPPTGPPLAPAPAGAGAGERLAQIAFDVDYHYYLLKNSSVQESVDAVEAIVNEVDFYYARDVLITYQITEIIVRTSQIYFPSDYTDLLDQFRIQWNTHHTDVVRDVAHLMTNKSGLHVGGVAYIRAICNEWAYGWSQDSAYTVGHELGHNWGAGHCHDISPCNNMCGACFYVGPNTKDIMTGYRDTLACLDDAGAYPEPLPPYAHADRRTLTRDALAVSDGETFDVLGNDHDGNLDPLHLETFDALSGRGGTVSLSSGSGPDGRDELVYLPPDHVFPGEDRFHYTVGDDTGLETEGEVTLAVPARYLAGYWPFDDATGTLAADASNFGRHASTEGDPVWGFGVHGGGLRLDGIDDAASVPPMQLRTDAMTITAWLKRVGDQNAWAGIVFTRDGNSIAGLSLGPGNELRYHWNAAEYGWSSGLFVPDLQWVFVALVVEPEQATIYLHDGTLRSAVHAASHDIEEFDGVTKIGHDPISSSRRFRGTLDDVRIHDHALDPGRIAELVERGGPAVAPDPLDAGHFVPALGEVSWLPGLGASSHDVYFGADYLDVRDAAPTDPEYRGRRVEPVLPTGALEAGRVYAWRVDEIVGADVVPGDVWLFERVDGGGHWKLDEPGGAVAADAEGGSDGTYRNGVVLGEPGAAPTTGTSVRLDGVDDFIEIPPLDLDATELTITGWAKRDGVQSNYAGIVYSRGATTLSGLSTLNVGYLSYTWNGAYYEWLSGLKLPDNQWAFFALVVRPDMATIYLGHDGQLESASNPALHGVEEFDYPLDLGRDNLPGRHFKGWLDDVRIYRAALTPREIEGLYTRALTGSGEVPDDALLLTRAGGGDLLLTWEPSCLASDDDYAVYEGALGDFASHTERTCSTGQATSIALTPGGGDRYFLVVPQGASREGSYGTDSRGVPREPGPSSCRPQVVSPCE